MKKLYLILLLISCFSCRTVYQVTEMKSSNVNENNLDKKYFYEDNNLKIFYDLWSQKGTLTFTLYNKTNNPIYIDWSHSNFIWNGYSIDYQKDVEIVKGIGSSTILSNGIVNQGFSIRTKEKPQTQLPPNSQIVVHKFNIDMPIIKMEYSELLVKEISYSKETSFFKFRNYLAYSFDKDLRDLKFIDNDFWVNKVYEMSKKTFKHNNYPHASLKNNKIYNIGKGAKSTNYGKNILSVNLFNLGWNDYSISYERLLFKKFSIKVPLYYGYSVNDKFYGLETNLFGRFPQSFATRPKQYYNETFEFIVQDWFASGAHIKFYPGGTQGIVRAFFSAGAEAGQFKIFLRNSNTPYPHSSVFYANYFGTTLNVGLSFQPLKVINTSLDLGVSSGRYKYQGETKNSELSLRIGFNVGFRF